MTQIIQARKMTKYPHYRPSKLNFNKNFIFGLKKIEVSFRNAQRLQEKTTPTKNVSNTSVKKRKCADTSGSSVPKTQKKL